jgi:predicted transcriptional regulator with HTH domain
MMAMIIIGDKLLDPGKITHSFKRSKARRKIYAFLCSAFPDGKSIEEISASTGYKEADVLGALMCYGDRYKPEDSLVALGIVTVKEEEYHGKKVMIFTAISLGKDVDLLLRDYKQRNNLFSNLKGYANKLNSKKNK